MKSGFISRVVALALCLFAGLVIFLPPTHSQEREEESQEEIEERMKGWAKALGVQCTHCHVKNQFKVWTPKRRTALWMYENIVKKLVTREEHEPVSCKDCHNGKARFLPHHEEEEE